MRRRLRDNSLTLVFGLLFLVVLGLQALAGHADYNQGQIAAVQAGRHRPCGDRRRWLTGTLAVRQ